MGERFGGAAERGPATRAAWPSPTDRRKSQTLLEPVHQLQSLDERPAAAAGHLKETFRPLIPSRRTFTQLGGEKPLLFQSIERDVDRPACDASIGVALDLVANRRTVRERRGLAQAEYGQKDDDLELAERRDRDIHRDDNVSDVTTLLSTPSCRSGVLLAERIPRAHSARGRAEQTIESRKSRRITTPGRTKTEATEAPSNRRRSWQASESEGVRRETKKNTNRRKAAR